MIPPVKVFSPQEALYRFLLGDPQVFHEYYCALLPRPSKFGFHSPRRLDCLVLEVFQVFDPTACGKGARELELYTGHNPDTLSFRASVSLAPLVLPVWMSCHGLLRLIPLSIISPLPPFLHALAPSIRSLFLLPPRSGEVLTSLLGILTHRQRCPRTTSSILLLLLSNSRRAKAKERSGSLSRKYGRFSRIETAITRPRTKAW